jgi:hypothetical protein
VNSEFIFGKVLVAQAALGEEMTADVTPLILRANRLGLVFEDAITGFEFLVVF